jgi:muramoyltetrapeptide carboxypeptidase
LLIFFFSIVKQSSSKKHDYTTNLQKEIPLLYNYSPKNVEDNLKPAIDLLHSWGLSSNRKYNWTRHNQLAGTDEQRAADFQQQLDNPISKRSGV